MKKSRRDFLIKSGTAIGAGALSSQLPPIDKLLQIITDQFIRKAVATEDYQNSNYISFNLFGGPSRWCFDQFIRTRTGQTIDPNPSVVTKLTGSTQSYSAAEYATIDYKGVQVPWLWNSSVQSSSGGRRPLNELLNHLLVFRGYGSGIDGHPTNFARQTRPIASVGSIAGYVADHSSKLFRALQFPNFGAYSGYSSIQGTGLSLISGSANSKINFARSLMNPFLSRTDTKSISALRDLYRQNIEDAHKQLRFIASQKYSGLDALDLDFDNSLKILKDGVEDIDAIWSSLYAKYETIILTTIRDRTVPGLSDRPIISQKNDTWGISQTTGGFKVSTEGSDLRDLYNQVNCSTLISTLALAEFVLTRGYSTCMEFAGLAPSNLITTFDGESSPTAFTHHFDQHASGTVPMTYMNSMFFRALGAGILELIDLIKSKGQFEQTFIHLVQEFGRTPRATGTGADHAFDGMISSVITGALNDKPIVLGNIMRSGGGVNATTYPGTFGQKGLSKVSGNNIYLTPAHVMSTLANLMRMNKNPWGNIASPLLVQSGNKLEIKCSGEIV